MSRPIRPSYNPDDWYWVVAGDAANVYGSARVGYCVVSDAVYLAWLALENVPTTIGTDAELQIALKLKDKADTAATKADTLVASLASKTPAQIDSYIASNVTDLAGAKTLLAAIAKVVGVLARGL